MNAPAKMGRPTKFTPELVEEVFHGVADGITLSDICRRAHMPARRTVYDWVNSTPELSAHFARAREIGFDAISEEIIEIVDNTEEDPASRKVRADVRLKLLAKWSPRYADRTALVGADGGAVKMEVEHLQTLDLTLLDDAQRSALREILEAARANQALDVTPRDGKDE